MMRDCAVALLLVAACQSNLREEVAELRVARINSFEVVHDTILCLPNVVFNGLSLPRTG